MSEKAFVVTRSGSDRRYQWCRCSGCGLEELCAPQRDFYVMRPAVEADEAPIYCDDCFRARVGLMDA